MERIVPKKKMQDKIVTILTTNFSSSSCKKLIDVSESRSRDQSGNERILLLKINLSQAT
jgi:hypothetical protein